MKILTALLFVFLAGCTKSENYGPITHDYDDILQQFNGDVMALGYFPFNLSLTVIQIVDEDVNKIAVCHGSGLRRSGPVLITVNPRRFVTSPRFAQTVFLYHEMGHCFLGLQHSTRPGKWLMNDKDLLSGWTVDDIDNPEVRRQYVKDLLETAGYGFWQHHLDYDFNQP